MLKQKEGKSIKLEILPQALVHPHTTSVDFFSCEESSLIVLIHCFPTPIIIQRKKGTNILVFLSYLPIVIYKTEFAPSYS